MSEGCRKMVFAIALICGNTFFVHAQSDRLLNNFFLFPAFYNPAASGQSNFASVMTDGRWQWIDSPEKYSNYMVTADMPLILSHSHRMGTGISAEYSLLPRKNKVMSLATRLSYYIKLGSSAKLSVGLQPEYVSLSGIPRSMDENGEITDTKRINRSAFNLASGVFFSTTEWWAGFSALNLISPKLTYHDESSVIDTEDSVSSFNDVSMIVLKPSLVFMAGGDINLKEGLFSLSPSVFVYHSPHFNSAQGIILMNWKKLLTAGTGYRWKDAVNIYFGANFKGFEIMYSYDFKAGPRSRLSRGSHEITLGYKWDPDIDRTSKYRYRSIRYM